jgi:predicted nucleic acid-binding protein
MNGRAFIDTNIFIYSVDRVDKRKAKIALRIIQDHAADGNGVISFQVVQEFFNVAFKRFPSTMTPEDCGIYLLTVFRPFLRVHSSIALYSEALSIRTRFQLSWYDSLILAAAAEAQCSVLYTEDLSHGMKIGAVRIENPFRSH